MSDDPFEPPVMPVAARRTCVSCDDALTGQHVVRCRPCVDAAWRAIEAAAGRTVCPSDVARFRGPT